MEQASITNLNNLTTPAKDGFRMPGEFEPHRGCIMIWPVRPGSWTNAGAEAKKTFIEVSLAIAKSEEVWMLCDCSHFDEVVGYYTQASCQTSGQASNPESYQKSGQTSGQASSQASYQKSGQTSGQASELIINPDGDSENGLFRIHVCTIPTDDAWARDVGPTCVKNEQGEIRGIDWQFNAWGGEYDGLYADWQQDDRAASEICRSLGIEHYDAHPFVLEGGSIHSDGEGTVMVTEACLLSAGRNPSMSKSEIEARLKEYLGAEKILWLPRGIEGDETNEHVDNVCAFVRPGEVVLAWTDDENDIQYRPSKETYDYLKSVTDARGRRLIIHKLPIPEKPVCITAEELNALKFEEGEEQRIEGERLAASYVNFYISNGGVILPQFGDRNDEAAAAILSELFPGRTIEKIFARPIIVGGGNIHCITQQIPR